MVVPKVVSVQQKVMRFIYNNCVLILVFIHEI